MISFDEMSTLDVPSAALRSSLDKIASALQKVGAAGTDASAAVDELRTSLRAAAAQSVKSARSLAKFDEINRLSAPAAEKADAEKTTAAAKKTGGSTRKSGSRSGSRAKAEADGEVSIWQAALQTLRDAWDGFWLYLKPITARPLRRGRPRGSRSSRPRWLCGSRCARRRWTFGMAHCSPWPTTC